MTGDILIIESVRSHRQGAMSMKRAMKQLTKYHHVLFTISDSAAAGEKETAETTANMVNREKTKQRIK